MSENPKMPDLRRFKSAVVIVSDRAYSGARPDETGPLLENRLRELGSHPEPIIVIPDDKPIIIENLKRIISENCNLILVSGGTGPAQRDVTPEATLEVIDKRIPGIEEHMRRLSVESTPNGMLSRGVVGIAGGSLIINLPGSPKAAVDNLAAIESVLEHTLSLIAGEQPHR